MAKKEVYTELDGQRLKLTNMGKILYPTAQITKAEVVQYMLQVESYMLPHIRYRPLTLIRYPDGVEGERFYAKNKPSWTPDWIRTTDTVDTTDNTYVMVDNRASLVWIGNLAGLELHPMNVRYSHPEFPDQFIFDLDPDEAVTFEDVKRTALQLRTLLQGYGYVPYIKTSGGKGFHIYVPVRPKYDRDTTYAAVQEIAKEYVKLHPDTATLTISKVKRKGKILIDILRNRSHNSCVAPYSLRGKIGAPVSMPFRWNEMESVDSAQKWNIRTALEYLAEHGDAWENIWKDAVELHTKRKMRKVDLKAYKAKRKFSVTSEPTGDEYQETSGKDFVIQLHDASNLHYDLRLEKDGVLKSWAIPKGLPDEVGTKQLAIQTEDHPLKYINFEGTIPKGEYGAGSMWVYDTGQYDTVDQKDTKITFDLRGKAIKGRFVLYNTKEKQWIIERKEATLLDMEQYTSPMLASMTDKIPKSGHFFEIKWDGIRAIFIKRKDDVQIYSRNGNKITEKFPLLMDRIREHIRVEHAVLDGEIVYLDEAGRPDFSKIVGRIHVVGDQKILAAAKKKPAVAYFFDLLYLDGQDCTRIGNQRRREWLKTILEVSQSTRFSASFDDGEAIFEAIKAQGMEGIICKKKDGKYSVGARSEVWTKVKVRHDDEAYVIGYTKGEGERREGVGALHLAKRLDDDNWKYMGKVGTGFDMAMLAEIQKKLEALDIRKKYISESIEKPELTIWVEPVYICELSYASMSSNDTYREPVYKRMREDID